MDSLKLSMLPMTSVDNSLKNFNDIARVIEALDDDVRLLCLPENSLYINLDKAPIPRDEAFHHQSQEILDLQKLCAQRSLNLHLGGIPWLIDGEVYNEALLITDAGKVVETYEKQHLFDVTLAPGIEARESLSYRPGQRFGTFEIDGWKFATCICYDLRFPELFIHYMEAEQVDAFLVPAAFTTKTGELHWKPLLQARAIEAQAYVVAAAQVGYHRDPESTKLRKSWGQSLVIDPWGRIEAETPTFQEFLDSSSPQHEPITILLERQRLLDYRQKIPVKEHRTHNVELSRK